MTNIFTALLNDENGFLVSAELILISTILVVGLVVGLTEVSFAVNNELEDVASAIGSVNQSFYQNGLHSDGKGCTGGSEFRDSADNCDGQFDIVSSGYMGED
ncbi:MAG: branched-chain amino acid aminotransferase [Planctomycetes bacterium]|nr:branched-chain amino acid aminotransferase [Planctomycetota bacterium]